MGEKLINEIKRAQKLMGINNNVFVELRIRINNKLLIEKSIKPQ